MNEHIDVKELVDYHCKSFITRDLLFQQVYEEILTFSYWVSAFKPHNILNIGYRGSTFHILSHLSTGKKMAIDIHDEGRRKRAHYSLFGHDYRLLIMDSHEEYTKKQVVNFCPNYDLIFIDGDHSYDGVKTDFELYKDLLSPRGYIVFHDIDPNNVFKDNLSGQVYKFWEELEEGTKTEIITSKSSGRIKINGEPEHHGGIGLWKP
jgi:predicted O-methyltransferase YrrM